MESEILIWSGQMRQSPNPKHTKFPFFLARGIIPMNPRKFMELLWDNNRTGEYNYYCLGRSNLLVLEDEILSSGASKATKVIQSETRVPFTSLSVYVTCVMHVRPLDPPDEGYVIMSRTLDAGRAGWHTSHDGIDPHAKQKNEILWGINVIRKVPKHPELTDLTSLSQVGTSLVPKFLAGRIGLMGVEDFFR